MDYTKLFQEGRAKSPYQLWSAEENEAVHTIAQETRLDRKIVADYVRAGIMTTADFLAAREKGVEAKSFDDVVEEAVSGHKKEVLKKVKAKRAKK